MGDRANVLVKANKKDSGVYLYTHWSGSELPEILGEALKKKWRWDDPPYLTRIIFDAMVGKNQGNETGFGVSTQPGDGLDRVLIVDCEAQTVTYADLDDGKEKIGKSLSFEKFIASSQRWKSEED